MDENTALLTGKTLKQSDNSGGENGTKVKIAQGTILVTITFERIAFYSLAGNLVLFLNKNPFDWQSYNTVYALLYFFGISYLTSFFGGLLADSVLGRFKTLLLAFFTYVIGYAFLPVLANIKEDLLELPDICGANWSSSNTGDSFDSPFEEKCSWLIFVVLTLIALGTGPFRSNIAPFGADQVRGEGPQANLTFFNWYYWCINVGSLVALSVITYVQQYHGFRWGYLSAVVCLGVSAFVFLCGSCCYIYRPRTGSVVKNIFKVLCEACSVGKWGAKKAVSDDDNTIDVPTTCLDYAKYRYGGNIQDSTVDEVKKILKIICVFITLIPYWMVYFQMETTFLIQGLHMNLNLPGSGNKSTENCSPQNATLVKADHPKTDQPFTLVAAWLSLIDIIFVIIFIPVFDRIIYPRLARAGRPMGFVLRGSIGMIVAAGGVSVAGLVEFYRLKSVYNNDTEPCCRNTIEQIIGNTPYYAADMSVLWQIPQYALIGLSEIFASIAALEFAYQMAPKSAKGIVMGLFYLFTGVGSFLGTATMYMFKNVWFGSYDNGNINCRIPCTSTGGGYVISITCHLDYYFYFLAGVEIVGLFLFLLVVKVFNIHREIAVATQPKALGASIKNTADRLRSPVSVQRQNSSDVS